MTVDEFGLAVEEAIEEREMKQWEIYDLRLYTRIARKMGTVPHMFVFFLKITGKKEVYKEAQV